MPVTAPPLRRQTQWMALRSTKADRIVDRETKDSGNYQVNSSEVEGLREELRVLNQEHCKQRKTWKIYKADVKIKSAVEQSEKKYNELQPNLCRQKIRVIRK